TYSGHADGGALTGFRELLRAWLNDTVDIGAERVCDIVLATDERCLTSSITRTGTFPAQAL
ncbi:MAG: hypothetical protein WB777_20485, partial [Mycobacterium sp.]